MIQTITSNLLNPEQAALILQVKSTTLAVWRSNGRYDLPFVKVGRKVLYRKEVLEKFLADRTFAHTGEFA